jgi:4-carboxymuconolactone decarboxylase
LKYENENEKMKINNVRVYWNLVYTCGGIAPKVIGCLLMLFSFQCVSAQEKRQMVRLAKIVIDSAQLENYKAFLKEEIEASVRLEPGVLTLYALSEKNKPTHITILEIYADSVAYKTHLQTAHFIKYKTGTKDMVKSLELVETVPLVPGMKIK